MQKRLPKQPFYKVKLPAAYPNGRRKLPKQFIWERKHTRLLRKASQAIQAAVLQIKKAFAD